MSEKLRFTGAWPSPLYWSDYPNWELALDEEGVDGQDETTLRPAEIQDCIAKYVSFTAGEATLANGSRMPALLEVDGDQLYAVNVFIDDHSAWRICYNVPQRQWVSFLQEWLTEAERGPTVVMSDANVFPLIVKSRLPANSPSGHRIEIVIESDGSSQELP
jgi:hypothetical protein